MDTFATCVKIVSKNKSETIIAKQLISNLLFVAYKLFLYKIRIIFGSKAHKDDGSADVWGRGSLISGHICLKSGAPVSFAR